MLSASLLCIMPPLPCSYTTAFSERFLGYTEMSDVEHNKLFKGVFSSSISPVMPTWDVLSVKSFSTGEFGVMDHSGFDRNL